MVPTKLRKLGKNKKRFDLITTSGIALLLLAVLLMYRVDQPSAQTGARTPAVKEAAAQASTCVDNARQSDNPRQQCDEAANGRPVTLVDGGEKGKRR